MIVLKFSSYVKLEDLSKLQSLSKACIQVKFQAPLKSFASWKSPNTIVWFELDKWLSLLKKMIFW